MKNMNQLSFTIGKKLKNKTIVLFWAILFLAPLQSFSYIPDISFVAKKMTSTTGRKIIQIDQEVTFKVGEEEAKVDETWFIEGDRNLKVIVNGKNLYKDSIKLNYVYNNKHKTFFSGKNKQTQLTTTDFYQKIIFTRAADSFMNYLNEFYVSKEIRLSRADGVVSFALGAPSIDSMSPQIWIGQDDFVIRKIRTPSAAEISFGKIEEVSKDLFLAKEQVIRWPGAEATIKVKKVNPQTKLTLSAFYPQNIEFPSELSFANKTTLTAAIEDFYSRFR